MSLFAIVFQEYGVVYFEVDTINEIIFIEPDDDMYFEELSFDSLKEAKAIISNCLDKFA